MKPRFQADAVVVCAAACMMMAMGTAALAQQSGDVTSIKNDAARGATNGPAAEGPNTATKRSFDAASLKERERGPSPRVIGMQVFPGRLAEACASLQSLIYFAYHLDWARPEGLPDWAKKACTGDTPQYTYDFQATMPADTTREQAREMLRNFLVERFKLVVHWEKRDMPVYSLVIAPGGFKLKPSDPQTGPPEAGPACPAEDAACHRYLLGSVPLSQLTAVLGNAMGRPVVDNTGLKGTYFFDLRWAGDMSSDSPLPSLPGALRELGLELRSTTAATDVLVVDHAEMPTEN